MGILIANDHPTLALKSKINAICREFFTGFGFNYFQYLRCFADGSVSLLTNHTGLFEYMQEIKHAPVIFSSFAEQHKNSAAYWFLWDEELPEFPVDLARTKFNIHNGLTYVRRSKNYYDMIAVALPQEQASAGSFYLNKLQAIEQFINTFDKDNKDLICDISKNPIALPEPYRDVNYKEICLKQGKFPVQGKVNATYITAQELACLRLLVQGNSHKQIANTLMLSPRTVETYLQRVRVRTGFASRPEIQRMLALSDSPLLSV